MNKIVIRSIMVAVAILLLLFIILWHRSPFGKSNSSFASLPQSEITKIEFSDRSHKLSLVKTGDNWLINGKTETRKSGILFIIRVLKEIKIKSPVSDDLFDDEIKGKNITPVKVKVYEKRRLLKSFLVYKTGSNIYGNIMKIKDRSKPFIVYVPGYEGDIGSFITLNELFWQPYTVFNLLPSEITSVKFENFSDTASSFLITGKNRRYVISGDPVVKSPGDSALILRYLSYFTWVPFEKWAFDMGEEEKNYIDSRLPLYRITVTNIHGNKTILTLWERMTGEKGAGTKDSDRLLGKTQNTKEFFVMRYFDIDPLIKKRSYFYPE